MDLLVTADRQAMVEAILSHLERHGLSDLVAEAQAMAEKDAACGGSSTASELSGKPLTAAVLNKSMARMSQFILRQQQELYKQQQ